MLTTARIIPLVLGPLGVTITVPSSKADGTELLWTGPWKDIEASLAALNTESDSLTEETAKLGTGDAVDLKVDVEDDILKRLGFTPVTQLKGPRT